MFSRGMLIYTLILAFVCTQQLAKALECEYFDASTCASDGSDCPKVESCEREAKSHCFALWKMNGTGEHILLKGCFTHNMNCYDHYECIERRAKPTRGLMFCCCEGDMCNRDFIWDPTRDPPLKPITRLQYYMIMSAVVVTITIMVSQWFFKYRDTAFFTETPTPEPNTEIPLSPELKDGNMCYVIEIPTAEPDTTTPPLPELELGSIQLIEIEVRERFGAVWKAQNESETVTVKIFPIEDNDYWLTEEEMNELHHVNNPDILEFVGDNKKGDHPQTGHWLVTAFHEKDSVSHYLKARIVTWTDLCRITDSIAMALAFLRDEATQSPGEGYKPAVAHSVFKSKNVVLKFDMCACLADFSLALAFPSNEPVELEESDQAGAIHNIAPEVLAADILYSRDAYFRIDMYALGLVLWELAGRSTEQDSPISEYMLEVGRNPTLKAMYQRVIRERQSPVMRDTWTQHPGVFAPFNIVNERLDHDADSRFTEAYEMKPVSYQSR